MALHSLWLLPHTPCASACFLLSPSCADCAALRCCCCCCCCVPKVCIVLCLPEVEIALFCPWPPSPLPDSLTQPDRRLTYYFLWQILFKHFPSALQVLFFNWNFKFAMFSLEKNISNVSRRASCCGLPLGHAYLSHSLSYSLEKALCRWALRIRFQVVL